MEENNDTSKVCRKYFQIAVAMVANFGAFAVGNCIVMPSVILEKLKETDDDIKLTTEEGSWFASIFVIGSIIGSLLGGFQTKYLGRKHSMMLDCVIMLGGLICIALANSFPLLLVGRLLTGYSNGSNKTSILPYTSEISQPQIRKLTGMLFSLFEQTGMSFIYMLGALLDWRTAVMITTVWPIITFILLLFCPKSPTWLLIKEREQDAYDSMKRLRGDENVTIAEVNRIKKNLEEQNSIQPGAVTISFYERISNVLFRGTFLRPFCIIVVLYGIGLQWTGAPFLSFYLVYVIKKNQIEVNPYWISAGIFGYRLCVCLLTTFISPFVRRRRLFLVSSFILATGGLMLGTIAYFLTLSWYLEAQEHYPVLKWLPILAIAILYTGLSAGFMACIWIFQSELLPSNARDIGSGLATSIAVTSFFLAGKFSPSIEANVGLSTTFWIFSGIGYGVFIFGLFCIPETYGLTLEDIEAHYRRICYGDTDENVINLKELKQVAI